MNQQNICPTEEWRAVSGYEGLYEVSNMGRVRSLPREVRSRWGTMIKLRGQVLKPGRNSHNYRTIVLSDQDTRACFLVHRLVAYEFIPNPEGKPEVNHKDGTPGNDWVDNLEWSTRVENIEHSIKILNRWNFDGSGKPGESNHFAKLTEEQVRQIRYLSAIGLTQRDIAERFNIHFSNVSVIARGKSWSHLK